MKINWGKLYDKYAACWHGIPTHFCGCRWDNENWCYECLNKCVEGKSFFYKAWILVRLWFKTIPYQFRYFINRFKKHETPFL